MALFGPKRVRCPAGAWTTLIWNFGDGWARTFEVRFEVQGGGPVAGEFLEKRTFWVFPLPPARGPLAARLEFRRHWINGYYSVRVRTDVDATATVK